MALQSLSDSGTGDRRVTVLKVVGGARRSEAWPKVEAAIRTSTPAPGGGRRSQFVLFFDRDGWAARRVEPHPGVLSLASELPRRLVMVTFTTDLDLTGVEAVLAYLEDGPPSGSS